MSITLYNQYIYKNGEWKLVGTSIDPPTKTSDLTNDSGFITAADIPVESVNGETGAVVLDAADVGAQPTITANGILKANGSGTVTAATAGTDYQTPLPSQSGNSGKYLTTNGTAMSWGEVDALPSQTGNSGKFLTTDGTDASWTAIAQDDHKWGTAALDRTQEGIANDTYVPQFDSTSDTTAKLAIATKTPANYAVAKYDGSAYLHSTTPTSSDNSTKVATTAYVDTAVGAITYPVTSVNTKTGAVSLTASDVGALPDSTTIPQGTVTSVRVQATSPVQSSTNTAQSTTLNTTISLADSYGDTKNPYAAKAKNTVLAGPSTGTATAPSFRTLEADDIPSLTVSKISDFPSTMTPSSHTHGNMQNNGTINVSAAIADGDKLVIADASGNPSGELVKSTITFGTSETTYLTNKGTWKTPDYPVTSVNTKTGAVSLTASDVGALPSTTSIPAATSDLTNDSGFITSSDIPVTSVNTKTGAVSLSASDVGALPSSTDVTKWNDVALNKSTYYNSDSQYYVPVFAATNSTEAKLLYATPTASANKIATYGTGGYLSSTTPSSGDNSTKVATTAYVDSAINELGSLLTFKGIVATTGDLPGSGNDVGDVWVVSEDNSEHVWTGSAWERLGTTVDLSGYVPTSRTVNNKALSTDITLSASDVGALPSTTDLSVYMQKGVDYVTAGQLNGSTLGDRATAEGSGTTASAAAAHAEGSGTTASAAYGSHAEGFNTTASGQYGSHAEGYYTIASGKGSHAEGNSTEAKKAYQHVFGKYNIVETGSGVLEGTYVEIVGNGTSSTRSNARTLDWSGNEVLAGKLTVGAGPTNAMDVATKQYVDNAIPSSADNRYIGTINGDGTTTSFTLTHNLNSRDLLTQVYNASTYDAVVVDVQFTTVNTITVTFAEAPTAGTSYKVVCAIQNNGVIAVDSNVTSSSSNPVMSSGIYTAVQTSHSNENLLDNWYFIDPVNSRGQTSYTNTSYTIDRWRMWDSGTSVSLTANGLVLSNSNSTNGLFQYLETDRFQSLYGKTITISAIIGGTLYSQTGIASSNCDITCAISGDTYFKYYCTGTEAHFRLNVADGSSITVKAVKLEIGELSTLEKDAAPNYGEELTKCIYSTANSYGDDYINTGFARSNRNLLDNWYFIGGGTAGNFPINQRGKNYYEVNDYTIDRWKSVNLYGNSNTVKVATQSGGLVLAGNINSQSTYVQFQQIVENPPYGKEVTLSLLTDNVGADDKGNYPQIWCGASAYKNITTTGLSSLTFTWPNDQNENYIRIVLYDGSAQASSIRIQAIKLELGSVSTLRQDAAPDYGVEFTRCLYSKADSTDIYANTGFGRTNPNLLRNWYFVNPVNSRGQTTYTVNATQYSIDGWYGINATSTHTLQNGEIVVSSSGFSVLGQELDNAPAGTYTLSLQAGSIGNTIVFYVYDANGGSYSAAPTLSPYSIGSFTFTVAAPIKNIRYYCDNSQTFSARQAKLEVGTISTLAQDATPSYGEELTRCIYSTADPTDTYANNGFGRSNENLIDNPWFNVNQRQVSNTTVSAGLYYFDRWMAETTGAVWSGTATGASINNSGQSGFSAISQRILHDDYNAGDVYTLSIKFTTNGRIYYGTGELPTRTSSDQAAITVFTDYGELRLWVLNTGVTAYNLAVQMRVSAGLNVKIRAIKLEKGAVCTLANDTMPNYQQDLAKCQRYFVRVGLASSNYPMAFGYAYSATNVRYLIPLPVTLRATPTLSFTGSFQALDTTGSTRQITAFTPVATVTHGLLVLCTTSNHAVGMSTFMTNANTFLDISCDL